MSLSSNGLGLNWGWSGLGHVSLTAHSSYLLLLKVGPVLLVLDHITLKKIGITHDECLRLIFGRWILRIGLESRIKRGVALQTTGGKD